MAPSSRSPRSLAEKSELTRPRGLFFVVHASVIPLSRLVISLNVNHTVDSAEADDGTQEAPEMKSKPNFEVDIIKGGKTLSFSCSYIYHADSQEQEAREEGYGKTERVTPIYSLSLSTSIQMTFSPLTR